MRVLLITGSFPPIPCGVGDYTRQLATTLAQDSELQVAVLTSQIASDHLSPTDFEVFPIVQAWSWRELSTILKAIRGWSPDLIHIQYHGVGYGRKLFPWILPLRLTFSGIPVVQTWHYCYTLEMLFKWGWFFRFIANAVAQGALIVVYKDYRARTDRVLRCVYLNKVVKFIPSCSAIPAVELSTDERQALRTKYATPNAQMIAYFGLIYESKRVELLFDIADAKDAHLVIIGAWFSESELQFLRKPLRQKLISYYQSLRQLAASATWRNKVTITGFVQANEAARIMAAADAVVLPYLGGGGYWNSSLSAAQSQGTFVLTTSKQHHGYNAEENVYFAPEHDVDEMRKALRQHLGMRAANSGAAERTWQLIRKSHIEFYRRQLSIK